jgi:hypothetical protein
MATNGKWQKHNLSSQLQVKGDGVGMRLDSFHDYIALSRLYPAMRVGAMPHSPIMLDQYLPEAHHFRSIAKRMSRRAFGLCPLHSRHGPRITRKGVFMDG